MNGDTRASGRSVFSVAIMSALFGALIFAPTTVFAGGLSVSPMVIDGKGKQREMLRYNVTLENSSNHMISLYPWVTDLSASSDMRPRGDLDGSKDKELKESLARWMEVTRSQIDLLPGDKRDIPVLVQINLNAAPGQYHAAIHFSEGPNRIDAEKNREGTIDVLVNIEVLDDVNERLQLGTFTPEKSFFSGDSASFQYRIENIGNRGIVPKGVIRIYDRRGEEVATVDVNKDGTKIEPNTKAQLASTWAAAGHFGKYKAMLDVEYGGHGGLQDTVFFWVLPWGTLLSYFFLIATITIVLALLLHSRAVSAQRGAPKLRTVAVVEEFDQDDEEEQVSLAARIRGSLPFFGKRVDDDFDDGHDDTYVDEFVEVATPARRVVYPARRSSFEYQNTPVEPRKRVVSEVGHTDSHSQKSHTRRHEEHTVTLSARPKKQHVVNPDHIVHLKRQ